MSLSFHYLRSTLSRLRSELRRATARPMRLALLILGTWLLAAGSAWQAREALREQALLTASTQWLGQTGWRIDLRLPVQQSQSRRAAPEPLLSRWPDLAPEQTKGAAAWLLRGGVVARSADERQGRWMRILLTNEAAGLAGRLPDGATPCFFLGTSSRTPSALGRGPVTQWRVGSGLQCEVQPLPPGWAVMHQETDTETLVLPVAAVLSVSSGQWQQHVERVWQARADNPCGETVARPIPKAVSAPEAGDGGRLHCDSLAASRASGAKAADAVHRWSGWLIPAAAITWLAAAAFYFAGLWPEQSREIALRQALGARWHDAVRRTLYGSLLQALMLSFALVVPLALWSGLMAVAGSSTLSLPRVADLHAGVWLGLALAVLLLGPLVAAWRSRWVGLSALGRLA